MYNWKLWGLLFLTSAIGTCNHSEAAQFYGENEAESWNSCSSVYLSSPCNTFDFQIKGLYLQPSGSNLSYAAEAIPLPLPSPNWIIHNVHPKYHSAFELGASIVCQELNSTLCLNWEHFYSKDSNSVNVGASNMVGPLFEIGPDAALYSLARGRTTFHYDSVNFDYGVFVNFGRNLRSKLYAGIAGAKIEESNFSFFSNEDATIVRTIRVPSKFAGVGPEFGFASSYAVWDGLQITGEAATSILIGRLKNHTTYEAFSPALPLIGIIPPNTQRTTMHPSTQVVPSFKGRLGLAYAYTFCNNWIANFEAGYQAQIYINAIQTMDMSSEVITPPVVPDTIGVFARTFHKTLSNFALAGPYINLNVAF